MVSLRVMPLHLFGTQKRNPLVEPLVAGLYRSALDNNGCVPLVVCHGCEVVKTRVQHHHAGRLPVSTDDIPFLREKVLFPGAVIRHDLDLVGAKVRDSTDFDEFLT